MKKFDWRSYKWHEVPDPPPVPQGPVKAYAICHSDGSVCRTVVDRGVAEVAQADLRRAHVAVTIKEIR